MTTQPNPEVEPRVGNRPFEVIRIGPVRGAIWKNVNAEGHARFNLSIDRGYDDPEGKRRWTGYLALPEAVLAHKVQEIAIARMHELVETEFARRRAGADLDGVLPDTEPTGEEVHRAASPEANAEAAEAAHA